LTLFFLLLLLNGSQSETQPLLYNTMRDGLDEIVNFVSRLYFTEDDW